jgi:hypothetical protein
MRKSLKGRTVSDLVKETQETQVTQVTKVT